MTARKTRKRVTVATEGGGPGAQATAARSGMMAVAGATDADEDLPLLTDEGDDTTMDGPVYDECVIRITIGQLRQIIRSSA